jgi:hypothetical protein
MITAHRTYRHFNLPCRSFDVDAYLNQQLALQAEERRLNALEANPLARPSDLTPLSGFRGWTIRLNERIERWMDRTDFKAIELKVERLFLPLAFTGIALYLLVKVADAVVSGAVAAAVR